MKIDLYERVWLWAVGGMLVLFFGSLANAAVRHGFHPPSHVETIDPKKVFQNPLFRRQGVKVDSLGGVHVSVVGMMYVWLPAELVLPAQTPITFHLTAVDVIHGFQIVRTNGQSMVIPGYISQFTTSFQPGDYLIACNEYCGVGHHTMASKLTVVPKAGWQPPIAQALTGGAAHAAH